MSGRHHASAKASHKKSQPQNSFANVAAVSHYAVGKTIGEGTFGKVKKGIHKLTGLPVAIKILEKDRIVDMADVERVKREIQILTRIDHPNIIQLYEVIDSPRHIFLIMEFASGGELFDYIVAKGRVPEQEACRFFHMILNGVDYCHQREIIHRDLKPENLLLDEDKSIKIVDFGLGNIAKGGRLLKTACGSPCYAAPEMIAGKRYVGSGADMWSLGVILFALVCGYLPFEDANTAKLYEKIMNGDYELPNFVPPGPRDLITKLLNTDPKKRFSAEQVRQHPWYCAVQATTDPGMPGAKSLSDLVPPSEAGTAASAAAVAASVDQEVIRHMVMIGYSPNVVLESLSQRRHDHFAATYRLLLLKRRLTLKGQDAHSSSSSSSSSSGVASARPGYPSSSSHHAGASVHHRPPSRPGVAVAATARPASSSSSSVSVSQPTAPPPGGAGSAALNFVPRPPPPRPPVAMDQQQQQQQQPASGPARPYPRAFLATPRTVVPNPDTARVGIHGVRQIASGGTSAGIIITSVGAGSSSSGGGGGAASSSSSSSSGGVAGYRASSGSARPILTIEEADSSDNDFDRGDESVGPTSARRPVPPLNLQTVAGGPTSSSSSSAGAPSSAAPPTPRGGQPRPPIAPNRPAAPRGAQPVYVRRVPSRQGGARSASGSGGGGPGVVVPGSTIITTTTTTTTTAGVTPPPPPSASVGGGGAGGGSGVGSASLDAARSVACFPALAGQTPHLVPHLLAFSPLWQPPAFTPRSNLLTLLPLLWPSRVRVLLVQCCR